MDPAMPPDLGVALRQAGLRAAGPLGLGGGGPRWSAVDGAGVRWSVTQVPAGARRRTSARLDALARAADPALPRAGRLVPLPGGGAAALVEAVPGVDLQLVLEARGQLAPPEVAGVLTAVGSALAAMHEVGEPHGDVAPRNVVAGSRGLVLVDLVDGVPSQGERTAGSARPDSARAATAADDVQGLGRLGLTLLGPAAGASGSPAGADQRRALEAVCRAACAPDRAGRPAAAEVAAAALASGATEPVRLPEPDVLARLALRGLSTPGRAATARPARGRHRGRRPRRGPAAGLAAAAVVAVVLVSALVARPAPDAPPGDGAGDTGDLAVALTVRRALALGNGDRAALGSVTAAGSPAAAADRALLEGIRAAGGLGGRVVVSSRQAGPVERTGPLLRVRVATRVGADRLGPEAVVVLVVARASGRVVEVG